MISGMMGVMFVIISLGESQTAAEALYAQSLTVNADGSLSVGTENTVRHFTARQWDGVSVIKYPDRVSSPVN
jgi:ABC-type molybdate transport system substrate-binding protein